MCVIIVIVIIMDDLIKETWNETNISDFYRIIESYKNDEKVEWTKNTVCTNYETLAVKSDVLRSMSKTIFKGNYVSFLDLMTHKYYESVIINGYLISLIKDYKTQIKYIDKLSKYIDCWAMVDTIKFSIKNHEEEYFNYALKLLLSKKTFERRIGVRIMFSYKNMYEYYDRIFNTLDSLKDEKEYYVNMAAAWLLCELFTQNRDLTLNYYKNNKTNSFIVNKSISKCRDSFRVSKEDKDLLLSFKIK